MITNKTTFSMLFLLALTLSISACGKKEGVVDGKADSQVVAKVNGDEISIHQVNFQLSRLGTLNAEQAKLAAKKVVEQLVEQQLLKQKAIEAKLDRDPRILQVLESSKDQILAQAYLEQQMTKADKPSKSEIDKFYIDHPELFQNRKVFKLQEVAVEANKDKFPEIEQMVASRKNISEMADWLKSKGYKFTANADVRTAEQLPLPVLLKLQSVKDGEAVAILNEKSVNIIFVVASQLQPVSKDKALPIIEQYFVNQNKTTFVKKQMEDLVKGAKIEYLGSFAEMQDKGKSKITSEAINPSSKSVSDASRSKSTDANQTNIDKGLAGL